MATKLKKAIRYIANGKKCSGYKPHSIPCRNCEMSESCEKYRTYVTQKNAVKSIKKLRSIRLREGINFKKKQHGFSIDNSEKIETDSISSETMENCFEETSAYYGVNLFDDSEAYGFYTVIP